MELLELLTPSSMNPFRALVPSEFKQVADDFPATFVAIGAIVTGHPVGLAIATHAGPANAQVLSVNVIESYRRKGVGRLLLTALEDLFRSRECRVMLAEFLSDANETSSEALFLSACGFSDPVPGIHIRSGAIAAVNAFRWTKLKLKPLFTVTPWSDLSGKERSWLQNRSQSDYPEILSPFIEEEIVDRDRSLILRENGQIAGWIMVEPEDEETVLFKTMFVFPSYQNTGKGILLMAELFRRITAENRFTKGIFFVEHDNEPMRRFILKHLTSPQIRSEILWRSSKKL